MNALEHWQQNNATHLAAALRWLRLRLLVHIQGTTEIPAPLARREPSGWQGLFPCMGRREASTPNTPAALAVSADELAQARREMAEAEEQEPPPALLQLAQRLGMSRFERELLLLCAAIELDPAMASLCARAQGSAHQPWPTFALALSLFAEPAWDTLSPERPLRHWRLLEIHQPGAQPLTASALRADERIVNFIKGLNQLDERLSALLQPIEAAAEPLAPSQRAAVERLSQALCRGQGQAGEVVQLLGPDPISKQQVAQQAASQLGVVLLRLPAELLPNQPAELETLIRLWQRESLLLPVALFLDAHEHEQGPQGQASPLERFLDRAGGVVLLSGREVRALPQQALEWVEAAKPTAEEQRELWADHLGGWAEESPEQLAGQFDLNGSEIAAIASREQEAGEPGLAERLWAACLARSRPRLDHLAQRLAVKASWADLVLPEEAAGVLRQIAAQVRLRHRVYEQGGFARRMNRGLGISALFAGESGTGKTMAAEVIANELGLDLYRIDLSAVVNKYIGETEKNLRRLFDAAEDGGAILFFDEAEALFAKRREGKDALDAFANIQIDYLLQRLEAYRGLAILATNLRSALDPAFERRLRFIVTFPFPSVADRQTLWERVFPAQTPTQDLNLNRLARLNLTGASIHQVAMNAAFLAAGAGTPVTMPLLLEAAKAEYRKLERPINEAEFLWREPAGAQR